MRETKFTVLKALAIILVVFSHAGVPGWLNHFLFIFHVPAFFLCAGYFFHTKYATDERTFVVHRIKGLYWPFVRWSVFFLVVHNLLFHLGILSETYGGPDGGVLHPYSWSQFGQHLWSIVVNMSGYDAFLCGTFWFFRALFLASLAYLVLFKLFGKSERLRGNKQRGWAVLLFVSVLLLWKESCGLKVTGVSGGGYRELMGLWFMAAGFLLRQYDVCAKLTWKLALPSLLVFLAFGIWWPSLMEINPSMERFLRLPLPAVASFLCMLYASTFIDSKTRYVKRALVYVGDRTLYIFAFHFVAFKLVSAIKVAYYGLPWEAIGGHPYVQEPANNALFVLLYALAGVGLPLLWLSGYNRISSHVTITEKQFLSLLMQGILRLCHWVCLGGHTLWLVMKGLWRSIVDGVKAIIAASSTKEE